MLYLRLKNPDMEIREASERHIPEITRLWMEFLYFNAEIEPFDTSGDNVLTQAETHFRNRITSDDSLVLVAITDQKVVGYSISEITQKPPAFPKQSLGIIYDIAISTGHRGKGIGNKMLDRIEAWFKERGIRRIEISVVTKNTIGSSFWREQGFKDHEEIMYLVN